MMNAQQQPQPHGRTPRVPTLTRHKRTGQGYVRLNGRCYYLGRYEDPETQARYHQRIAEWMARGRQLPVEQEAITVLELCSRFWRHAEGYYRRPDGRPSKELDHFRQALKPLAGVKAPGEAASGRQRKRYTQADFARR